MSETAGIVTVRPTTEADLPEVTRICRVAFGTFFGAPDPEALWLDRDMTVARWKANPGAALTAEIDGRIVGSNFLARWGSFAFFGPLTIRPDLWDKGVAQKLLAPTVDLFDRWGVRESGLFTFPHSPKHLHLYQKFGFWPRFLTALMGKPVEPNPSATWSAFSTADEAEALIACRELTDTIYEGLDLTLEIRSVKNENRGETVLLWGGDTLDAFAVCHCGTGSEAGADTCYIKFAAVRPGPRARDIFSHLLNACESLAAARDLHRMSAGVNLNRGQAYRAMLEHGYRSVAQGVAMHRPDAAGYNREDVFIVDDWR